MKRLTIIFAVLLTATSIMADEFKIGKLTFETISPTEVSLKEVDIDISKVYLSETIDYQGNTYTLTEIGYKAFEDCSSLISVTIPNGVTSIESTAFRYCSSLTSVTIPNSVTSIGVAAFGDCSALTSVTIPNSVTSIGSDAFGNCSSLTSVIIPNSVTEIGDDAFANTALFNDPTNWDNGALYINDCLIAVDASVVGNYKIKENTRLIGGGAFGDCSALTSVTIPNSVTSIGDYAFSGCKSLSSVTIPNSVTSIGNFAFIYCSSLTSVTIPNSVTSIGWDAFSGCKSLKSVTIPNSVTSIGWEAFANTALFNDPTNWDNGALYINDCLIAVDATFVGNYKIKENTRLIGGGAFYDCSALTSVTIPNSVKIIGEGAFSGCKSLTSVTIPNNVTSVGRKVFCRCSSLTSVTIGGGLTEVGEEVFANCSSLTSVTIPNSVTEIGGAAFYDCSSLTSVTIPNSVTRIGWEAFEDCSALTSVTIPNSVTWIGYEAFKGCPSLTSIIVASDNITYDSRNNCNAIIQTATNTLIAGCHNTIIPNSVTRIGVQAFKGCSSLTAVTIPNSVTSIGDQAFDGCSSLTSVTIPNSVTEIGIEAFCGCTSLKHITIPKSLESMGETAFCESFAYATKATDNIVTDESIEQEIANDNHFVDLGLPSGTLWKSTNERGLYSYDDAVSQFANKLPTIEQFAELITCCDYYWNGAGYTFVGTSGESITLPAEGLGFSTGEVKWAGERGFYWSSTPKDYRTACGIDFYSQNIDSFDTSTRSGYESVRLVSAFSDNTTPTTQTRMGDVPNQYSIKKDLVGRVVREREDGYAGGTMVITLNENNIKSIEIVNQSSMGPYLKYDVNLVLQENGGALTVSCELQYERNQYSEWQLKIVLSKQINYIETGYYDEYITIGDVWGPLVGLDKLPIINRSDITLVVGGVYFDGTVWKKFYHSLPANEKTDVIADWKIYDVKIHFVELPF